MVRNDDEECQVLLGVLVVRVLCPARVPCLYQVQMNDQYWLVLVIGFDCAPLDLEDLAEEALLGTLLRDGAYSAVDRNGVDVALGAQMVR